MGPIGSYRPDSSWGVQGPSPSPQPPVDREGEELNQLYYLTWLYAADHPREQGPKDLLKMVGYFLHIHQGDPDPDVSIRDIIETLHNDHVIDDKTYQHLLDTKDNPNRAQSHAEFIQFMHTFVASHYINRDEPTDLNRAFDMLTSCRINLIYMKERMEILKERDQLKTDLQSGAITPDQALTKFIDLVKRMAALT